MIRPPRQTDYIGKKAAINLRQAIRAARYIGTPLNTFLTINFAHTPCPAATMATAFEKLRDDRINKWLRRPARGGKHKAHAPTFVWALENKNDIPNAHMMLHVPRGREEDFANRMEQWVESVTGGPCEPGAIDIRPVDREETLGMYFLKGAHPAYARLIKIYHEPQGWIIGKRCGHSRNLGPTARKRVGFRARRYIPNLTHHAASMPPQSL